MGNEAYQKIIQAITEAYGSSWNDIIQYELQSSKAYALVAVSFCMISLTVALASFVHASHKKKKGYYDDTWACITYLCCAGVFFVALIAFLSQMEDIYTATYYPQKMIMIYIRHTIQNTSF